MHTLDTLPDCLAQAARSVPALDWQADVAVLGRVVQVRSNTAAVLRAVRECFGSAGDTAAERVRQLDIVVPTTVQSGGAFEVYAGDGCILAGDGASTAALVPALGRGWVLLQADRLAGGAACLEQFIEFPVLALAADATWYALRAWVVAHQGRALLLLGEQAAELAHACRQVGLHVLPRGLVYFDGLHWRGHVRPAEAGLAASLPWSPAMACLLLPRGGSNSTMLPAGLEEFSAALAAAHLDQSRQPADLALLAPEGAFRLETGARLDLAAELLRQVLRQP